MRYFFPKAAVFGVAWALVITMTGSIVCASDAAPAASEKSDSATSPASPLTWKQPTLENWWKGDSATAQWYGLAHIFEQYGLKVLGEAKEDFFGQLSGGLPNQSRNNWTTEIKLKFLYDFSKVAGIEGLTFQSCWRDRESENPALPAGTSGPSNLFAPTNITSALGPRIMSQQFEYTTPNKMFTINAGWESPYEQFLQQPLSKLFQNNNIYASKGIGGQLGLGIPVINNDIASSGGFPGVGTPTKGGVRFYSSSPVGFSSSYAAWGATLKVKPTADVYIQSGLYEAIAGTSGVNPTQFLAANVYPYTSVPASYLGKIKNSNEITPVVGGDGSIIPGALQNLGWVPSPSNNHGFNFGGAPGFTPSPLVAVKPTNASGGTIYGTANGASTYTNANGQYVTSPGFYAASPYDQGGLGGAFSHNGFFNMNEIGWTPKFGTDKLEGKYAFGSYIWWQPNTDYTPVQFTASLFDPTTHKVIYTSYGATKPNPFVEIQYAWGLYLQADQQIFRIHEKKDAKGKLSERGLYAFSLFTFNTPQNNALPYYFHTGLVFKGPLASRPKDCVGIAFCAGFYSSYLNAYTQSQNQQFQNAVGSLFNAIVPNGPTQQGTINPQTGVTTNGQTSSSPLMNSYAYQPNYTSTEVIEAFYKIQINNWASFKPDVQYIINPAGNRTLGNDWIVGFSAAVTF